MQFSFAGILIIMPILSFAEHDKTPADGNIRGVPLVIFSFANMGLFTPFCVIHIVAV